MLRRISLAKESRATKLNQVTASFIYGRDFRMNKRAPIKGGLLTKLVIN